MDRQTATILRCIANLIGIANSMAVAMHQDHELEYQQALREFNDVCAETDRLLAEAEDAMVQAQELGPT